MVALDLDGTLLNKDKAIGFETLSYLQQLHNHQIEIVIATGRCHNDAVRLTQSIPFEFAIMSNNGAITRTSRRRELLDANYIDNNSYQSVIQLSREWELHPIVYVDKSHLGYDLIVEQDYNYHAYNGYLSKSSRRVVKLDFKTYLDNDILSICYTGDKNKLDRFRLYVTNKWPKKFNTSVSVKLNVKTLMEILNTEACKWKAIEKYSRSKKIKQTEIIAIGDDNNDIEMIKNAGFGIAIENATAEVKSVSKLVSEYNHEEQGVRRVLETIFGDFNGRSFE